MKKIRTWYWIVTILFAGFMIFSSISNVTVAPEAVAMITGLGYPKYFIPFIGVAKLLGAGAVLMPGLRNLKEWAYAGLFFDLLGAAYSAIAVGGFQAPVLFMALPIGLLFASYFLWHKKLAQERGA